MAQSTTYRKLCLSDLSEVRDALFDVRSKWENIGIELLNKNDTDAIKRQHSSLDPVDCLTEMLSVYLKRDNPEPSWDAIIAALRARAVGESGLAQELDLEQRYIISTTTPRQTTVERNTVIGETSEQNQEENVDFPYLDVSNLSSQDRRDLIQKLSRDYTNILKKFAKLEGHIRNSLNRRNIPAEGVANCALNLALFKSDDVPRPLLAGELESFEEAKSIDKIFILLKKHALISYFNYGILKHVVETHGTEDDKCKLKEYEDEFEKFCLRKVYEVPPVISKCTSPTRKIFKVMITRDMRTTLTDVAAAERKIADVLGLRHSVLTLHEIIPGSLILTLSVPATIVDELFPLKEAQLSELKANGFTILSKEIYWKIVEQPGDSIGWTPKHYLIKKKTWIELQAELEQIQAELKQLRVQAETELQLQASVMKLKLTGEQTKSLSSSDSQEVKGDSIHVRRTHKQLIKSKIGLQAELERLQAKLEQIRTKLQSSVMKLKLSGEQTKYLSSSDSQEVKDASPRTFSHTMSKPTSSVWKSKLEQHYLKDKKIAIKYVSKECPKGGFKSTIYCPDIGFVEGVGTTKAAAENNAAYNAMKKLEKSGKLSDPRS